MNSQSQIKLQVWLLILVVFALGGITGASLDRVYLNQSASSNRSGKHAGRGVEMMEKMKADLQLNEQQMTQIKQIFDESRRNFRTQMEACTELKNVRNHTDEQLRTVMSETQFARFKEITAQRAAERKQREESDKEKR